MTARKYPSALRRSAVCRPVALLSVLFPLASVAACSHGTNQSTRASTAPPASVTSLPSDSKSVPATPTALPDPLRSGGNALGPGDSVVLAASGSGDKAIDLSRLPSSVKTVRLRWVCIGPSNLEIKAQNRLIVGSACSKNGTPPLTVAGGSVPRADVAPGAWRLVASAATHWRIVVVQNAPG